MWNAIFSVCQSSLYCPIVLTWAITHGSGQCVISMYVCTAILPAVSAVASDNSLLMAAGQAVPTTRQSMKWSVRQWLLI
jgi:hypothetical protein